MSFHFVNLRGKHQSSKGDPESDVLCDMQDWISYLQARSSNSKMPVPSPIGEYVDHQHQMVPFGQHTMTRVEASLKLASIEKKLGSEAVKNSAVAPAPLQSMTPTPTQSFIAVTQKNATLADAAWVSGVCAETDVAAVSAHVEEDMEQTQYQQDLVARKAAQSNGETIEEIQKAPLLVHAICGIVSLTLEVKYFFSHFGLGYETCL